MKQSNKERGMIKSLVALVIGACGVLLVIALLGSLAQNTGNPWGSFELVPSSTLGGQNSVYNFTGLEGGWISSGSGMSNVSAANRSQYSGKVGISLGNTSSVQPIEEYISIYNSGAPVDITGWALTNSKGTRPIENSQNSYFYPTADTAVIGQGTEFLDPSGQFAVGDIVLGSGDTAYIMTGGPFTQYSFSIYTSFRENACTGYLRVHPFSPPLSVSCPYITNDPAINTITDQCYDYVSQFSSCRDPEKEDKKNFDLQTTQCKNFITSRLNYPGCVAQNRYKDGFKLKTWRIFLGRSMEMWGSRRDTVTLYDKAGKIVDQVSY